MPPSARDCPEATEERAAGGKEAAEKEGNSKKMRHKSADRKTSRKIKRRQQQDC